MKMNLQPLRIAAAATLLLNLATPNAPANGSFAATVTDYHPGAAVTLTNPYAAVGKPAGIVGAGSGFDSVHSPFNPHYEPQQLAQIGEGGELILRLGSQVDITPGTPEIGIFTNVGLVDGDYPNGLNNTGPFGIDAVTVDVSPDGLSWTTLGAVVCDFPSSGFVDAPGPFHPTTSGLTPSDFAKPHDLVLADLDGKTHSQIVALLAGSAGGSWIDLDPTGLASVAYIRLRVPDDDNPETQNTFELAAVSINSATAGAAPEALDFAEDFATNPLGTRAASDAGHASYAGGALTVSYDLASPTARTAWPLGGALTDATSFSYTVEFSIEALDFNTTNFGQLSFGLINAATTGNNRTSVPSNAWDLLMIDYFPNQDFTTFSPTVIGSQRAGQGNAFDNLGFPAGSASLINEFDEIGQLPTNTSLSATLGYESATRNLTLQLEGVAINAFGPDPDGDQTTIEYVIPAAISFSVDSFAIVCWNESSGGTASLKFTRLSLTTPSPPANYYSWADANIAEPLDRATGLDANRDGLSNLLDYALGGTPPTISIGGDGLILQWQEFPARRDVVITPRSSHDLRDWTGAPDSIINSGPGIELHQSSISRGGTRQFLHLNATRP